MPDRLPFSTAAADIAMSAPPYGAICSTSSGFVESNTSRRCRRDGMWPRASAANENLSAGRRRRAWRHKPLARLACARIGRRCLRRWIGSLRSNASGLDASGLDASGLDAPAWTIPASVVRLGSLAMRGIGSAPPRTILKVRERRAWTQLAASPARAASLCDIGLISIPACRATPPSGRHDVAGILRRTGGLPRVRGIGGGRAFRLSACPAAGRQRMM